VAAKLDLSPRLPLAAAAVVVLVVIFLLCGTPAVILVGAALAGLGLTTLAGLPLRFEERLAYGAVIGAIAYCAVTFLLCLAFGLTLATALGGLVIVLAAGGAAAWRNRAELGEDLAVALERWGRAEPWPLWLLLVVCWGYTLLLLSRGYQTSPQGLLVGGGAFYADWSLHLTLTGAFAYGGNFPPAFPIFPGHAMTYPFMVDFFAAALVPVGASLTSALVLTSGYLGLAFPAVLYMATLRLIGSRGAGVLAVLVFCLGGGLGFVLLGQDLGREGLQALVHLPRLYTQEPDLNLQWLNPVLAWMLPQRSVLFGYAVVPLVLGVLWTAERGKSWVPYAFCGVLTGLLPLFHLHAFGTLIAMPAFWAVLRRRRQWLAFFAPAVLLGAPVALWLSTGGAASLRVQLGWLAAADGHDDNVIWFWIWNTGLFIPLLAIATFGRRILPQGLAPRLAPIWLWFLIPNLVVFQPWDWDNTKFFAYWALVGSIAVAALLVRLWQHSRGGMVLTAVLVVLLCLAGSLDLDRSLDTSQNTFLFTDPGGIQVAAWVRTHTPRTAIFLVAPVNNEPIPTLAGRRVVSGYPGWLWTYGLPGWSERTEDVETMLAGKPGTARLARRFHVAYVVLGPQELQGYHGSVSYWEAQGSVVYRSQGYTVVRVKEAS
jgi:hypothetical protein